MRIAAIILAAGESSRAWPLNHNKHKSIVNIGGKSLLERTIDAAAKYVDKVVVVVSPQHANLLRDKGVEVTVQPFPKSTADAAIKGYEVAKGYEEYVVLNGYHAFSSEIIEMMINKEGDVLCLTPTQHPSRYGIANVEGEEIKSIVEKPQESDAPSNLRVIGIYKLKAAFFELLNTRKLEEHDAFEKALSDYAKSNNLRYIKVDKPPLSLKYVWQYLDFVKAFLDGVNKSFIHKDATIAKTAVINDSNGGVIIEKGAKVLDYAVIKGPAYIGKDVVIGNYSIVRESNIESAAIIGAHSEVARSLIGPRVHIHRSYIGDSIIDEDVKIGAGFIAANRLLSRKEIYVELKGERVATGRKSFGCAIGKGTSIGVQSSAMPGTLIAPALKIKPHSMLKGNVHEISDI